MYFHSIAIMTCFFYKESLYQVNRCLSDEIIKYGYFQDVQSAVLIRGGTVVNDDQSFKADVYIENNVIRYAK